MNLSYEMIVAASRRKATPEAVVAAADIEGEISDANE